MSYKALLNAKAVSSMYNNTGYNPAAITADAGHYANDDDDHDDDDEEEDEDGYVNGDGGSPGEATAETNGLRRGPNVSHSQDRNYQDRNLNLKRCRFAPRQDIELLKELRDSDDKPFLHAGKSSWDAWGKIAHALNQKQIFGPVLTLSALTCKLRFEFLLKNLGGHALKYNAKRGTSDEFQKRDELITQILPEVPDRGGQVADGDMNGSKRRRGRPRKLRERFSPSLGGVAPPEMEDEEEEEEMSGTELMNNSGYQSKRKPGRPRKIPGGTPAGNSFMDGAQLAEYIQNSRPRTRQNRSNRDESTGAETPQAAVPGQAAGMANSNPYMHYMQPTGLPEGSIITMLAEYLKRHHESDLQYKREEMEARQREKSEERRLEREQLEVKKAEMELRRAELQLQQQKWSIEQEERRVNLELMKKKLYKQ